MINLINADITTINVDAVVNAANEYLVRGGGVCGAIHKAAGQELQAACMPLAPCKTGSAVITPGFNLPAKYVIHAVGPVYYENPENAEELLKKTYLSCLNLLVSKNLKSIAFPCISTGVYGFPKKPAADIAFKTVNEFLEKNQIEVTFVCFEQEDYLIYKDLII